MRPTDMKLVLNRRLVVWHISIILQLSPPSPVKGQHNAEELLKKYQYDIATEGQTFLLNESRYSSFFLLGELHGEQEIPQLLYSLWPKMNEQGYDHIIAELSPWSANKLEFAIAPDTLKREGLWTNKEAKFLRRTNSSSENPTIWGCDMEEVSIDLLIESLAKENPSDGKLKKLVYQLQKGYNRKLAPALLGELEGYSPVKDLRVNGISLYSSIISTLKIDSARAFPETRLKAQITRENLMKEYFFSHYKTIPKGSFTKFIFRFGRNHLHRGFDSRGISTLGNFVSELAFANGLKSFNVAAFAAGGQYSLGDQIFDADERSDDSAFQFLWEQANYNATVFDLRPLRNHLHVISSNDRTELQKRLLYWADSYDAIICYKNITPIKR
jgi:hypothetical protein